MDQIEIAMAIKLKRLYLDIILKNFNESLTTIYSRNFLNIIPT